MVNDFIPRTYGLVLAIQSIPPLQIFNNIIVALTDGHMNADIQSDFDAMSCLIILSCYFFKIYALVMDFYCLVRLFKKYKVKTDCHPNRNYNIIIYAGDAHARVYRKFMKFYGGLQITRILTRRDELNRTEGRFRANQYYARVSQRIFKRVYKNKNELRPNIQSCVTLDPTEQGIDTRRRRRPELEGDLVSNRSLGNIYESLI